jgi:hypothetical protein
MKLPIQRLEAEFAAADANRDERTVPMTFYAGATVLQFNWENGLHNLQLSMEPKAVRLKRLNGGRAPFTLGHTDPNNTERVIGVIVKGSATVEGGAARAEVRFSKRADVEPVFADVMDGILRNVSVGARLHRLKEITAEGDEIKTFLALDWEPTAVALVAEGADPGAHFAAEAGETECDVEFAAVEVRASSPQETEMEEKTIPASGQGAPAVNLDEATLAAQTAERARVLKITQTGIGHGLMALASEHIEKGTDVAAFQQAALTAIAAREEKAPTRSHSSVGLRDEGDTRRKGFAQAMLHRADPKANPIADKDPGYDYRGLAANGMLAMAAEICRVNGQNPNRMDPLDVARFAMSTSDFPYVLADSANTSLRAGYGKIAENWTRFGARRSASTFKTQYEVMIGGTATFPKVPESGEYKESYISEGRESWKLYTYANKLAFTRQTIVNDELGAFTNVPSMLGMKAAMAQAKLFWDVVIANATMVDTYALFATTGRNNLVTAGTVINVANLGIIVNKLMLQTDMGGEIIGLVPKYLLVPPALRQVAKEYMSSAFNPATPANVNPEAGTMEVVVEPRISAAAGGSDISWYIFADPGVAPCLIYAYLNGQEGVYSETKTETNIDGMSFTARFDFGVGAIDYRGACKNDGA